jgi:hypothetical protein
MREAKDRVGTVVPVYALGIQELREFSSDFRIVAVIWIDRERKSKRQPRKVIS